MKCCEACTICEFFYKKFLPQFTKIIVWPTCKVWVSNLIIIILIVVYLVEIESLDGITKG